LILIVSGTDNTPACEAIDNQGRDAERVEFPGPIVMKA
jgi:hypothetical protein